MYVVTVEFVVKAEHAAAFRRAVLEQAESTLGAEPHCVRFDVCVGEKDEALVFLYEIYLGPGAFEDHLRSPHFRRFDETTRPWIASKTARSWRGPLEGS